MTVNEMLKAVPELNFTELQAYLRNTGWDRIQTPKDSIALFHKMIGEVVFETALPLSKDFSDYSYRIIDVLEKIAQVEQREVHQVLTDLSIPPADIVRFRVINRDTIGGTISFLEGFRDGDITALVDFVSLDKIAKKYNLNSSLITQNEFLLSLGLEFRLESLIKKNPEIADNLRQDFHRLTDLSQMGELFKVHIIWK
jgi:SAM-dependent MidA family methyltransferase